MKILKRRKEAMKKSLKRHPLLSLLCTGYVAMMSTSVNAALIDRGGGLIYDDDRNITWMQDAYAAPGLMGRADAMTWVDNLTFGGFSDWRLPSTLNIDPSCGTDATDKQFLTLTPCSGGEMGHLIYSEGLTYLPGDATLTSNLSWGSLGLFDNVYGGGYWTSTDYLWTDQPYEDPAGSTTESTGKPFPRTPRTNFGWLFYFGGDPGAHKTILATTASRAVWAVRDGDVAAVPLPGAVWLFGSGLLGLVGLARRKAGLG